MQTLGNLKAAVAGFMHRDPATFIVGTAPYVVDVLTTACNNARLYAERVIDFELSKGQVTIPGVTLLNGGSLNNAVLTSDGTTSAAVKKIITPFIPLSDNRQFPVDLWSKTTWNNRIKRRFEGARPTDTSDYAFITDSPFCVVQDGKTLFVVPPDTTAFPGGTNTFVIQADVVLWLPHYGSDLSVNDFLLDNCFDWLMYRTIYELNFFLKEDERVSLSARLVADAWDAVIKWNNELIAANVDDVDLE